MGENAMASRIAIKKDGSNDKAQHSQSGVICYWPVLHYWPRRDRWEYHNFKNIDDKVATPDHKFGCILCGKPDSISITYRLTCNLMAILSGIRENSSN